MNTSEKEDTLLIALALAGLILVVFAVVWVSQEIRAAATPIGIETSSAR